MADQLSLFEIEAPPLETVTFVAVCAFCGEALAAVPNVSHEQQPAPGYETWRSAEMWCYLANKQHEPECVARQPMA